MITINKTKRETHTTLFPGYQMNRKCDTIQYGACIIGGVFERITEKVLGGERRTTNSENVLCPDVSSGNMIAESKAFRAGGTLLIKDSQLSNYRAQTEFKTVVYCIWAYGHRRPIGDPQLTTEGQAVLNVTDTLRNGYVFDVSILSRLNELKGKMSGVNSRHCRMWFKNQGVIHRDFFTLKFRVLEEARKHPRNFLKSINLDPKHYEWSVHNRRINFEYESIKFTTRLFQLFTLKKKPEKVPF